HPSHRKRMAVREGGRQARTTFRVVETLPAATFIEAQLYTGRTHQIRVHFHHLGFPLVGDQIYGQRQNSRLAETTGYVAPRQMLHAWKLGFVHPMSAEEMSFEAPLPQDFRHALAMLRDGA